MCRFLYHLTAIRLIVAADEMTDDSKLNDAEQAVMNFHQSLERLEIVLAQVGQQRLDNHQAYDEQDHHYDQTIADLEQTLAWHEAEQERQEARLKARDSLIEEAKEETKALIGELDLTLAELRRMKETWLQVSADSDA